MRASLTSATATIPFARAGATRRSHAANPGAGTRRPNSSVTRTRRRWSRSGMLDVAARERLVGLDDLLHQFVPDHVAIVEMDKGDALDRAHHFHRLDQPRGTADRQIDLGDVAGDDR